MVKKDGGDVERERWLEEILTLEEAARARKVHVDTIRNEIKRGTLKAVRLSKRRYGMTRREALKSIRA